MKTIKQLNNGIPQPTAAAGGIVLAGVLAIFLAGCCSVPTSAPPAAGPVDLTAYYNGVLEQGWHPKTSYYQNPADNHLAELPQGTVTLGETTFNVRGVIQLAGTAWRELSETFPTAVTNIVIGRKVGRFHFLHGTGWQRRDGTIIGSYEVHYANGQCHEIPIIYGRTVRDWWFWPREPETTTDSELVWKGGNPATKRAGMSLRLYKSTIQNPFPEEKVVSLDFRSRMTTCAPFLIAITTEKP